MYANESVYMDYTDCDKGIQLSLVIHVFVNVVEVIVLKLLVMLVSGMDAVPTVVFLKQASITMNVLFLVKKRVFAVLDGIPKRII